MSAPRITVIGSVNLDLVVRAERLPKPGETVLGGIFAAFPGGKGANQALAAARLGAQVRLIAGVGRDAHAEAALALLKAGSVKLDQIIVKPHHPTGIALIAVAPDGENQILVAPGANAALSVEDLPAAGSGAGDGALIAQNEIPAETLAGAVRGWRGFVALNLAPALPVSADLLTRADLIVVNQTEAAYYGRDTLLESGGLVAITLGAGGAELYRDGVFVTHAKPPEVRVVDATGAGDSFVAALTFALLEGRSDDDSLAFACAAGALATTVAGAQPALPHRVDVEALLRAGAH